MAHVTLLARHRLKDLDLALEYARDLSNHTRPGDIPFWARDLTVLLLEDLCELEAARVLLGGMLADGTVTDPGELAFLERKLSALEASDGCPDRVESILPGATGPQPAVEFSTD